VIGPLRSYAARHIFAFRNTHPHRTPSSPWQSKPYKTCPRSVQIWTCVRFMRVLRWGAIALLLLLFMNSLNVCSCGTSWVSRRALGIHRAKDGCTPRAPSHPQRLAPRTLIMPPRVAVPRSKKIRRTTGLDVTQERPDMQVDQHDYDASVCSILLIVHVDMLIDCMFLGTHFPLASNVAGSCSKRRR
jgi:hypothetical protein